MSAIAFNRSIGPVPISCVISEQPVSELEITEIPIEFGAAITDHAYPLPKKVRLEIADAGAAATFNALVRFQESRVPFTLVTGLSVFRNMLIKRIEAERDKDHATILSATVDLQEIIIVDTAYATADPDGNALGSGKPGGDKSTRSGRPTPGRAGDAATGNRASGTVHMGDNASKTVGSGGGSMLNSMFGG
jgi:hypothetical protein